MSNEVHSDGPHEARSLLPSRISPLALGLVGGAIAGSIVGLVAGLPGIIGGAISGALIGAAASAAAATGLSEARLREEMLDRGSFDGDASYRAPDAVDAASADQVWDPSEAALMNRALEEPGLAPSRFDGSFADRMASR
jgi:hypothetical protein